MPLIKIKSDLELYYQEFGSGDRYVLSAQMNFCPKGMQQALAQEGYHVFCITLRGFAPSTLVTEDYGEKWYDVFAGDVIAFADMMGIDRFIYMGASHGSGVGWHICLNHPQRLKAFVAVVCGPHNLDQGQMSYRKMHMNGLIKPPPFNPPIDNDPARQRRRDKRALWIEGLPEQKPEEKAIDYRRPLVALANEENLKKALGNIHVPVLLLGGIEDPISPPELMVRTARCLKHCKLIMYSNCGHDVDTDLIEETTQQVALFLSGVENEGRWYLPVIES